MEDERNERSYFFRNLIVKILLVLLFVFLLMWLFPMPNLNPFYDKIFTENMSNMTDAAKGYFTISRLPKEEGEVKTLTLKEMIDNKMILEFTDSNGKACDLNKSYVEVTKKDGEYIFKTNLSCSSFENYVIEYFGCYDVCSDGKCNVEVEPVTKDVTEYRFYKIENVKQVDKYLCDSGYTLSGKKCILKTSIEKKDDATLSCGAGYTFNKNTNKCEKEIVEKLDAKKACEPGYTYVSSIDKCIKDGSDMINANVTYKCTNGTLNGTKCNTTMRSISDPQIEYSCENGTLSGDKCVTEKDARIEYSCTSGTLSGTNCITSGTYTTPETCGYSSWICSQPTSSCGLSTVSSTTFTRRLITKVTDTKCKYEECTRVRSCEGGNTVSTSNSTPAIKNYKCDEGKLNGTKCIISTPATAKQKCTTGTFNGTYCLAERIIEENANRIFSCETGTLNGDKCIISKTTYSNYNYTCEYGILSGNVCLITTNDKVEPTYTCKDGYTKVDKSCYKMEDANDIKNATITYKTTSKKVYKWSTEKTLEGWTKTGETRTTSVNITSK